MNDSERAVAQSPVGGGASVLGHLRLAPTLGWVAILLVLTGPDCGSDDARLLEPCDCLADPAPRCVVAAGQRCADSSECATGLICRETLADGRRCQVETQTGRSADVLTAGFDVPRMRLVRDDSELGVFHWTPVAGAEYVSCALFACFPEVSKTGGRDGSAIIGNYDKCVLARETAPIEPPVPFVVGGDSETTYSPPAPPPGHCRDKPLLAPRKVTTLSIGCIAYDTTEIVAATHLLFLSPQDSGTLGGHIPLTDTCIEDHEECYRPDSKTFGTCMDGRCRPRCLVAADCCEALEQESPAQHGGTARLSADGTETICAGGSLVQCVLQDPPIIGVCRARAESELER